MAEPSFESKLTDLIIDLDHLRRKRLEGTTRPAIFFRLKHIFHMLESIGSARIEGNNTTIAEYIETKIKPQKETSQSVKEIQNIEKAMSFIEANISDYQFLQKEILLPTINYSLERQFVTENESKILKRVVEKQVIQSSDLEDIFSGKLKPEISRQIRKLIDKKMLAPIEEGKRKYVICFDNNYLLRGVIKFLGEKGFLPVKDESI